MRKWWQRLMLRRRLAHAQRVAGYEMNVIREARQNLERALAVAHRLRGELFWLDHGKVGNGGVMPAPRVPGGEAISARAHVYREPPRVVTLR